MYATSNYVTNVPKHNLNNSAGVNSYVVHVGVEELHFPSIHVAKDSPFNTKLELQLKEMYLANPFTVMMVLCPFLGASRSGLQGFTSATAKHNIVI